MIKRSIVYLFIFLIAVSAFSDNQIDALKKINAILKNNINKLKKAKKTKVKKHDPIVKPEKIDIQARSENNSQVQPFIDIGLIQLDLNNLEEAQLQFEKALKIRPDIADLYYYLAKVYEKKYQNDIAIEYYKKAIEKNPDYKKAKEDVIKLLDTLEKQLKSEIKMDPSFPDTYMQLGYVYMQKKNYPEAERVLKKAISLNGKSSICYDYLGILYYKSGDLKKAYKNIEKAFQLDSDNPIIYQHYKMLSEKLLKTPIKITKKPDLKPEEPEIKNDDQLMKELNLILIDLDFKKAAEKVSEYEKKYGNSKFLKKIKTKINQTRNKRNKYIKDLIKLLKLVKNSKFSEFVKAASGFKYESILLPDRKKFILAAVKASICSGNFNNAKRYLKKVDEVKRLFDDSESSEILFVNKMMNSLLKGIKDPNIKFDKYPCYRKNYIDSFNKASGWFSILRENLSKNLIMIVGMVVGILVLGILIYFNLPFVVKKKFFKKMSMCKNSGDWQQLLEHSAKITKYGMNSSEKYLFDNLMIRAYLETGDYEKTVAIAKKLLKKDPQNRLIKELLGKAYLNLGRSDSEIIPVYMNMLKYDFSNSVLIDAITDYYIQAIRENKEEFLNKMVYDNNIMNIFKRTLRNFPDNMKVLKILGRIYLGRRKTESDAIKVYEKILEFEPQNLEIHKLLAQSYFEKELFEKASKEARYILNYDVENMMVHRILQQSMLKQGLLEQLIELYQSIIARNPDAVQVKLLLKTLQDDVSNKFYSKVKEKEEDFEGRFKNGIKYMQEGNVDSAIKMFEISFNMPKLKNRSAVKLIECYISVDLLESAEEYFQKLKIDYSMMGSELKNI
ncbi:tetratricopeptide repeat protein, partial [bacterium]|nr:tetratricopeptide repeat protein [bacterium]